MRYIKYIIALTLMLAPVYALALTPIAHTDVVPYQRIEYGTTFNFGVVAFSKAGIDRVDFAISGQGYSGGTKSSSSMALNTRVASTSPGAESPGVHEYYVTISANEFTSNGTITVTPTVHGDDAGTKELPAVTLYVEGASNESPTEAWVDIEGSDGTGTLDDDTDPFISIDSAMAAINTQNGDLDYSIIYLVEDVYDSNNGTARTTTDEWVTITRAFGAAIENVIIDEDGTLWDTNHIRMYGLTLRSTGDSDQAIDQAGAWIDYCRSVGPGDGSHTNPVRGAGTYITSTYIYNVRFALKDAVNLVRGVKVYQIFDDFAQNKDDIMVVNCQIDNVHGTYSGNHSDAIQIYSSTFDNVIFYGNVFTNLQYQGLFLSAGDGLGGGSTNWALVNNLIEIRVLVFGGGTNWIHDGWDHFVVWHNTFTASFDPQTYKGGVYLGDYGEDGDDMDFRNMSVIGNMFRAFYIDPQQGGTDILDFGNEYGNEANYNHYESTGGTEAGENYTTGLDVIDLDTPGSETFGYPVPESTIVNRLPSNLTGVPCDAYGNPRDLTPDVGALELPGGSLGAVLGISGSFGLQ